MTAPPHLTRLTILSEDPTDSEVRDRIDEVFTAAGIPLEPVGSRLHHYTSASGLRGILGDGKIFMTHLRYLDDITEVTFGMGILHEALGNLPAGDIHEALRVAITRAIDTNAEGLAFAACFCEDDDLLPNWRAFGNQGAGYAIGFDGAALSRDRTALLMPVTYGRAASLERINRTLDWTLSQLRTIPTSANGSARATTILTSAAVSLTLMSVATKDDAFAHEREWRLLQLLFLGVGNEPIEIEFRDIGGLLIPYIVAELPKDGAGKAAIAAVRYGPTLRDNATELSLRLFLDTLGMQHVPILPSRAALRR